MKHVGLGAREPAQIFVTRPNLPPLEEFVDLLRQVWDSRMLTNRGPMVQRFERALCDHLGVEHISVVNNAAIGLMVALMQTGAKEVLTTPFSFVATANAIRAVGAKPVFADIDPVTFALDPAEVERRITPETGAILAVHCYGLPCDVAALEEIGARHGIPVIYDAAHAFAVSRDGQSLLRSGTMSVVSFHATKVFNTAEGGAIICKDAETKQAVDRICNHGITDETTVDVIGLNGKMSELNAALGLVQLRHVGAEIAARDAVVNRYEDGLSGIRGIRIVCPRGLPGHNNYAYPILVEPEFGTSRDALQAHLKTRGILARRYFYPLIPDLAAFRDDLAPGEDFPVARQAAERVLCLPMYGDLEAVDQQRIIDAIIEAAG